MSDIKLPELPEPWNTIDGEVWGQNVQVEVYTAGQLREYAKQAAELARSDLWGDGNAYMRTDDAFNLMELARQEEREACAATIRALFANRVGTAEWAGYAEAFIRLADEAIHARGTK